MNGTTVDDYCWLRSEEAQSLLARIAHSSAPLVGQVQELRRHIVPARASLLLEQIELRRKARGKFRHADRMLFTTKSLQQASGERISHYKALRFPAGERIADLCCGIGGDLLELAARGPTVGVEYDEVTALLAAYNAELCTEGNARVERADVSQYSLDNFTAWHIDPDRRSAGQRAVDIDQLSPRRVELERLLSQVETAAIKLAPATSVPVNWRSHCEREWIGEGRECKQQVVWHGSLAQHVGGRVATLLGIDGSAKSVVGDLDEPSVASASEIGSYIFEPHAAVLAANLARTLAVQHQLRPLAPDGPLLTGEQLPQDELLSAFRVRDVLPCDLRKIRRRLQDDQIGHLELKRCGGVQDVFDRLSQLSWKGKRQGTLVVTRHAGRNVVVLGERMP